MEEFKHQNAYTAPQTLPKSTASLVLGILSIIASCCCSIFGSVFGIIGLVFANSAIALYNQNPEQYTGYDNAKAGRILSIIGIVLGVLMLLVSIFQIVAMGGLDAYMEQVQEQIRLIQELE